LKKWGQIYFSKIKNKEQGSRTRIKDKGILEEWKNGKMRKDVAGLVP
jgi:hypothetical protein